MSKKKFYFFKSLSFDSFILSSEGIGNHNPSGLFYVLIFIVLALTAMQVGGQVEFDDLSTFDFNSITSSIGIFFMSSFTSTFPPDVFALILFFECLRSHIGEKHPADLIFEIVNPSSRAQSSVTALFFHSAVILSLISVFRIASTYQRYFLPIVISDRRHRKIIIQGGL